MKYSLVVLGVSLLVTSVKPQAEADSLIFAYHVARHGPANGNREVSDILNDGKIDGELSKVGRQWSYGAGRRLGVEY